MTPPSTVPPASMGTARTNSVPPDSKSDRSASKSGPCTDVEVESDLLAHGELTEHLEGVDADAVGQCEQRGLEGRVPGGRRGFIPRPSIIQTVTRVSHSRPDSSSNTAWRPLSKSS